MKQRIQKIISASGLCSRKKAEDLIASGKVNVNGERAVLGSKADPEKDNISVNGKEIKTQAKAYYALNKPKEVVVTKRDPQGRKNIFDLPSVRKIEQNLMHVGRLDYMSEGLLLLTTDGDFANLVAHPSYEIEKTYLVRVEPRMKDHDLNRMRKGISIEGFNVRPARVRMLSPNEVEIVIHEGKNRIIRRMMEALGYRVFMVMRVRVGPVELGRLKCGEMRRLTRQEINKLMAKKVK